MFYKGIVIGLDFDGTVVTHEFPAVGKDLPLCIATLKRVTGEGGKIVLITMRTGKRLAEAVAYLSYHDIPLYGVNSNPRQHDHSKSPKIYANLYIDDAALGCPLIISPLSDKAHVDWQKVNSYLFPGEGESVVKGILMEKPVKVKEQVYQPNRFLNFLLQMTARLGFD